MNKRKLSVDDELYRIKKYFDKQSKRYGDSMVTSYDSIVDLILTKYKSKKTILKHLQELTTKKLQERIRILVDEETGESMTLSELQSLHRSEANLRRYAKDDMFYPSMEDIMLNNAGEEMADFMGEPWNYEEFSTKNYKDLREAINEQLRDTERPDLVLKEKHYATNERASKLNNWLDDLVSKYGLGDVARMLNVGLGQNAIDRQELFYEGKINYNFFATMLKALNVTDEERSLLLNELKEDL